MEEVEVLVRDSCQQGQDGFSLGKENREGCQGVCERSDAVGPASEARAGVVKGGAGDGCDPGLVDYTHEGEDQEVDETGREDRDL